jgi:DUF1009 family protein
MANDIERLVLKGAIAELPESDRLKVDACARRLRQVLSEFGDAGLLALMLVMFEQDGK